VRRHPPSANKVLQHPTVAPIQYQIISKVRTTIQGIENPRAWPLGR